jgi:oligopeptide transport system substrate-binding protein
MEIKAGQFIGKYRIIEPRGQGGMATVYKGYDTQLERDVAIKLIRLEQFGPAIVDKMRLRFEREAKTLAKLTHPYIVNIIDYGEFEGIPYLVMPFLQGGTLKQSLGKPMPLEKAASMLSPIADALAYAHQKGIVHRDVKPANIMFTETGQPMLTDFGIVRLLENEDGVTLTGTGMGIGTPEYMSPEQGLGHEVDGRTDIYSLGTVLYELITGQKPYTANTPMEIVLKQSTIPLKKPSLVVPALGDVADQILLKAMAREPEDRYASMKDFKTVLEKLKQKEEISVPAGLPDLMIQSKKIDRDTDYFLTQVEPKPVDLKPVEQKPVMPVIKKEKISSGTSKNRKLMWLIPSIIVLLAVLFLGTLLLFPDSSLAKQVNLSQILGGNQSTSSNSDPTRVAYFATLIATPVATREPFVLASETLRINLPGYPGSLDPQKASWVIEVAHLQLIYEGLTKLNTNLETEPGAAESWTVNADGTEFTFNIRSNLHYSDGALLNAKRFEYSILRNMDPVLHGDFSQVTDDIVGAYEYRSADASKLSAEQLASLRAAVGVHAYDHKGNACTDYEQEDCLILVIKTKYAAASLPTILSLHITYPAREELITSGGDTWWKDPSNLIGNGAFILDKLEENTVAHFRPNPYYLGIFAKVNIEYFYMSDSAQAFEAYRNGEVDIISLAAEDLAAARAIPALNNEISITTGYCTYALMMNQTKAPFNDPKIREAFSYGMDREYYVQEILEGLGSATLTWIPKGFPGYDSTESHWAFDPEKAKQAMIESSYGAPQNLPEISFTFGDNARNRARYQKLADYYQSLFGVQIKLNAVAPESFPALISNPQTTPQLYISGWCADYPDPRDWLSFYWKTGTYGSRIGYSDPEVDALLDKADAVLDPTERLQWYADAQRKIVETAPAVFMYNSINAYLIKPYVKNLISTAIDNSWAGVLAANQITIQK